MPLNNALPYAVQERFLKFDTDAEADAGAAVCHNMQVAWTLIPAGCSDACLKESVKGLVRMPSDWKAHAEFRIWNISGLEPDGDWLFNIDLEPRRLVGALPKGNYSSKDGSDVSLLIDLVDCLRSYEAGGGPKFRARAAKNKKAKKAT